MRGYAARGTVGSEPGAFLWWLRFAVEPDPFVDLVYRERDGGHLQGDELARAKRPFLPSVGRALHERDHAGSMRDEQHGAQGGELLVVAELVASSQSIVHPFAEAEGDLRKICPVRRAPVEAIDIELR